MGYTGFERLLLFFAFSFFGWVLETVTSAVRQRRFVNRGLVNGPFCVLYGITGTAMLVVCRELHGIWLFLGSMIFSTLAEWIASSPSTVFFGGAGVSTESGIPDFRGANGFYFQER